MPAGFGDELLGPTAMVLVHDIEHDRGPLCSVQDAHDLDTCVLNSPPIMMIATHVLIVYGISNTGNSVLSDQMVSKGPRMIRNKANPSAANALVIYFFLVCIHVQRGITTWGLTVRACAPHPAPVNNQYGIESSSKCSKITIRSSSESIRSVRRRTSAARC